VDREVRLADAGFVPVGLDTERMFSRGGSVDLRRHALALTAGMATDVGTIAGLSLGASYAWWRGDVVRHMGLALARLAGRTDANQIENRQIDASLGLGRRWVGRQATLSVIGEVVMRWSRQRLLDRTVVGLPDWRPSPVADQTLSPGAGATLSLGRPFGEHLAVLAEGGARFFAVREREGSGAVATQTHLRAGSDLSLRVGVAMWF
jgi:hypothetical protein